MEYYSKPLISDTISSSFPFNFKLLPSYLYDAIILIMAMMTMKMCALTHYMDSVNYVLSQQREAKEAFQIIHDIIKTLLNKNNKEYNSGTQRTLTKPNSQT